jgi:peptide/nickel transport system substrate-binding protein
MTNTRPRAWRLLAVLLALGLVAAACGDDSDSADGDGDTTDSSIETGEIGGDDEEAVAPEFGGEITVGLESETNSWSTNGGQFANSGLTVAMSFYDPLVSLTDEGEFAPFLAETLEPNDDLTEWTVGLRDGVTFHDGSALDAEALKWNWDNLHFIEGGRNKSDLDQFGAIGMEIVDPMTVVYQLEAPNAAFPDLLRGDIGWPVSPTAVQADPEGWGDNPVGTGPFVFESWTRVGALTGTRPQNNWMTDENGDQLPYLDGITFRPIPDDTARTSSLQSDDIQVLQTLRGPSVKQVQGMVEDGGYGASLYVGNTSSVSMLNNLVPPLDDLRIRTALALSNDAQAMAAVRNDDGLVPASTGYFSQDSPWYSADADAAYPAFDGMDAEEAAALVDEYKNDPERSDGKAPGEPITVAYQCQPDATLVQGAQLLQALWGEIGIEVELSQVEQAAMITNVVGSADTNPPYLGAYEIACFRAGGGDGDPLTALQGYFGPIETTTGNFANFTDPEITDALATLRGSADFAERYAAVETISRVSAENVPFVWNIGTPTLVGYRGDLHGIVDWTLPDGTLGTGTPGGTVRWHQVFMSASE